MNHLKAYPAHLALYLIGAVDFIAQLPAAGPLAPYTPWITAAGAVGAALHHAYQTGAATAAVQTVAQAASSAPAKLMLAVLMLGALVGLHGCATLSKLTSPSAAPYITAAVDVAVATAEAKGVPAAQINSVAKQALAADAGSAATLATVTTVVNAQLVKLKLPAGDLAAATILEDALTVAIQAQVGANPNVATAQAVIADVLQSVIAATGG